MGMFDNVRCKRQMPDGYEGGDFQTKDLACELAQYEITEAGRLVFVRPIDRDAPDEYRDTNFHGWLNFYDYSKDHWRREYRAKFTDGNLQHIEVVQVRPPEPEKSE